MPALRAAIEFLGLPAAAAAIPRELLDSAARQFDVARIAAIAGANAAAQGGQARSV
jgi:hypothetical protein